jgi:hypothetical protein
MWKMSFAACLMMITSACAMNGSGSVDYCAVAKPIYLPHEKQDKQLEIDIITHNETWDKTCNKPWWRV